MVSRPRKLHSQMTCHANNLTPVYLEHVMRNTPHRRGQSAASGHFQLAFRSSSTLWTPPRSLKLPFTTRPTFGVSPRPGTARLTSNAKTGMKNDTIYLLFIVFSLYGGRQTGAISGRACLRVYSFNLENTGLTGCIPVPWPPPASGRSRPPG